MKKTISINISGQLFHINEDAFDKLNHYLKTIGQYFEVSGSREEIMGDIESRIAEMLKAKITEQKQVITMYDVDQVIALMGQPEDFMDPDQPYTTPPAGKTGKIKRLFRDTDERILGGVCAGISAYLGIRDAIWLRLAFVIMFFAFGTGPVLYIILWIIMPPARTAAEKLEMKGEQVNISSISKAVSEEAEAVKTKFNNFANSSKTLNAKGLAEKTRNVGDRFIKLLLDIAQLLITSLAKLLGLVLLVIAGLCLLLLIGLLVGHHYLFFNEDYFIGSFNSFGLFFFDSIRQMQFAQWGLFLLIGVPIISLIFIGGKLLLGIRRRIRGIGSIMTIFWLSGLIICGYVAFELSKDFRTKSFYNFTIMPEQPQNQVLLVGLSNDTQNAIKFGDRNFYKMMVNEDNLLVAYPRIEVEPSLTDSFEIEFKIRSFGQDYEQALNRSKRLGYNYSQVDSMVLIDAFYTIGKDDKFRGQKLTVTIKVPVGNSIEFHPSIQNALHNIDNLLEYPERQMAGKRWLMTKAGLDCEDC